MSRRRSTNLFEREIVVVLDDPTFTEPGESLESIQEKLLAQHQRVWTVLQSGSAKDARAELAEKPPVSEGEAVKPADQETDDAERAQEVTEAEGAEEAREVDRAEAAEDAQEAKDEEKAQDEEKAAIICHDCQQVIPTGLTFCAVCGGEPAPRPQIRAVLLVKAFDDEKAARAFVQWAASATEKLGIDTIADIIGRLPAIFPVEAPKPQLELLEQWLADAGIRAKMVVAEEGGVPWLSETFGAIWVSDQKRWIAFGIIMLTILAMVLVRSMLILIPGALAFLVFYLVERARLAKESTLDARRLLGSVGGFGKQQVDLIRRLLKELKDVQVRRCMTICVLQYQAMTTHLHSMTSTLGDAPAAAEQTLRRLITQALLAGDRYLGIEAYAKTITVGELESEIAEAEQQRAGEQDPEKADQLDRTITQRRAQLSVVKELQADGENIKSQLMVMAATVESLRARMVAMAVRGSAERDALDEAMSQVSGEIDVLESTVKETEALV